MDISPLRRDGSSFRTILFVTWAVNALIFLTIDFLPLEDFATHSNEQNVSKYTIELSSADVQPDVQITFYQAELGTVSSYDVNPHKFEIKRVERVRGPPI
jgi:hypothetical protein